MKDLFMCLLLNLKNHGSIIGASLYKGGVFASLELETEDAVYTINITKAEKPNEN